MLGVLLAAALAAAPASGEAEDRGNARAMRLLHVAKDSMTDAPAPCVDYSEEGKPFVTCFDPWRGLELGGAGGFGVAGAEGVFTAGIRIRGERDSRSKQDSTWLNLHRLGAVTVRSVGNRPAVQVTGYQGHFRRHVREGVLLFPTTPPRSIPFPLDIAFETQVFGYERRQAEGTGFALEPVRLGVMLDPLRSASGRFHLGVGVTGGYRLRLTGGALEHDITPLTAATVRLNLEGEDGLWAIRGAGTAGWTFAPGAVQGVVRAHGELDLSRVLVAINDQPVSLFLHAEGAWNDAGAAAVTEGTVLVGARVQLWSARD